MSVELNRLRAGSWRSDVERWGPGLYTVWAPDAAQGAELLELLAGRCVPREGQVLVNGHSPARRAVVRRRVGSLFMHEEVLPGPTLSRAVARALRLRGVAESAMVLLSRWGLEGYANTAPALLGSQVRRAVALALALETPHPLLLALYEPLALDPYCPSEGVVARLRELARELPVVCVVAEPSQWRRLGGEAYLIGAGLLQPASNAVKAPWLASVSIGLEVRCEHPRRLLRAVAELERVQGVQWAGDGSDILRIVGAPLRELTALILTTAEECGAGLFSWTPLQPGSAPLEAAHFGWLRGTYDAARHAALRLAPRGPEHAGGARAEDAASSGAVSEALRLGSRRSEEPS